VFFLQFPFYAKLTAGDRIEWGSRVVSTVNALYVTYGAFHSMIFERVWDQHPFLGYSAFSDHYHRVFMGYIAYDLILVLSNKCIRSKSTIAHHVIASFAYSVGVAYRSVQMLTNAFLATEATTPFVNNRWFMAVTKLHNTRTYILNGLLMTFGFLFVRVLFVPYISIKAIITHWDEVQLMHIMPLIFMYAILPSMTLLNVYWCFLMLRGLVRVVAKGNKTT